MIRFIKGMLIVVCALTVLSTVAVARQEFRLWDFPYWSEEGDNFHFIVTRIAQYERLHPEVDITLTRLSWAGGPTKLRVSVAGRRWPDMCRGTLNAHFIIEEVMEPVCAFFSPEELADFFPAALDAVRFGGRLWGFPSYMTTKVVLLNRSIFEERGVRIPTFEEPWTFEEFRESLRQLTFDRDGDGRIDVYGIVVSATPGTTSYLAPFFFAAGAPLFTVDEEGEMKAAFNTPETVKALRYLQKIILNYSMRGMAGFGGADAFFLLRRGRGAVSPTGTWAIPPIRDELDLVVAPFPVLASGDTPVSLGDVSVYQIFKQPTTERVEILADFAEFLISAENQRELVKFAQFPTRKSAGAIYRDDPLMAVAAKIAANNIVFPRHPARDMLVEIFTREIQLVLLGEKSAEEALEHAQAAAEAVLAGF